MSDQANKILSFLCIILLVFLVFSILLFGKKKYDDPSMFWYDRCSL